MSTAKDLSIQPLVITYKSMTLFNISAANTVMLLFKKRDKQ